MRQRDETKVIQDRNQAHQLLLQVWRKSAMEIVPGGLSVKRLAFACLTHHLRFTVRAGLSALQQRPAVYFNQVKKIYLFNHVLCMHSV